MTDVGIFAPKYSPQTGGAAVYFRQVKRVLEPTAYTPHILTTEHATGGDRVHPVFPEGLLAGARFVPACWRLLRRQAFDLLHVHPHFPQWRLYRWLRKATDIPVVYDCRDRLFDRRHVSDGDHYLSAAEHIDTVLHRQGVEPPAITRAPVVLPPVDPISPLAGDPAEPVIAFVGDLTDAKGLPEAVGAVGEMDRGQLHVAGAGAYATQLAAHTAPWLRYWGELPHPQAVGLIDAADVLVLPSRCEGRPRVVLEALAVGTPVVATDVGDVRETVGEAGVIVTKDSQSVRRGIEVVLNDGEYSKRARARQVRGDEAELREAVVGAYEATLHP